MDAETTRYALDIVLRVVFGLLGLLALFVAVIYGMLRREDKRNSDNVHSLRNLLQQVIEPRLDAVERWIERMRGRDE